MKGRKQHLIFDNYAPFFFGQIKTDVFVALFSGGVGEANKKGEL